MSLEVMHIVRWCVGAAVGLIAGFILLSILAVFLYALPRAVLNAARGLVRWNVSGFYLVGALAYAGALLLVALPSYWLPVDRGGLIFGLAMATIAKLANLRALRSDVDRRLAKHLVTSKRKELPIWANRWRSP